MLNLFPNLHNPKSTSFPQSMCCDLHSFFSLVHSWATPYESSRSPAGTPLQEVTSDSEPTRVDMTTINKLLWPSDSFFSCIFLTFFNKNIENINLTTAFDTMCYTSTQTWKKAGITGNVLSWFRSYLFDRRQFVSIDRFRSDMYNFFSHGVPQGSDFGCYLSYIHSNIIW